MDTIQIKSYLTAKLTPGGYEIRRFEMELPSSGGFALMVTRLVDLYSGIIKEDDELKVCWLDEENEQVGFRSDAELEYAINYHKKKNKKRICSPFSSTKSEITLRVYLWTRSSVIEIPTKNFKKSTSEELKKLGRNALKSASKDLTYLRTHNVKLLKPGTRKTTQTEVAPESNPTERTESVIPVTAGWYDVEPDNKAVDDVSVVEDANQITLDSLGLIDDETNENLRHEIEQIRNNSDLDEAEKDDRILKVNVKYYIAGLLDAVCRE